MTKGYPHPYVWNKIKQSGTYIKGAFSTSERDWNPEEDIHPKKHFKRVNHKKNKLKFKNQKVEFYDRKDYRLFFKPLAVKIRLKLIKPNDIETLKQEIAKKNKIPAISNKDLFKLAQVDIYKKKIQKELVNNYKKN
jgi:hypothetical protein